MMSVLKLRLPLAPLLLVLLAAPAHAVLKTPIVTPTRGLSYGKFVANTGGTILMSTAGLRSKTGGVVLISGGTVTSASFSLSDTGSGKSGTFTTITLPGTATMTSGPKSMTLTAFVSDPPNTVLNTGKTIVLVGATLNVGPNQAPGNYTGNFPVTVNYQ